MKKWSIISAVVCLVVFIGVRVLALPPTAQEWPEFVSIMALICHPEKYDGKKVIVIGVGEIKKEGGVVYFCREHYDLCLVENSLWLDLSGAKGDSFWEKRTADNGKYVWIKGVFDKNNHGQDDRYPGTVRGIEDYEKNNWKD